MPPPRWIGLLPLGFLSLAVAVNARSGTPETLLWICNVSNALLAIAIFAAWPRGLWAATLWLIVGMPLWFIDSWANHTLAPHSFLTHIVSAALGVWAVRRVPAPEGIWWQSLIYGVSLCGLARLLTAPEANVNLAYRVPGPTTELMPSFAVSWVVHTAALGAALWGVQKVLGKLWLVVRTERA